MRFGSHTCWERDYDLLYQQQTSCFLWRALFCFFCCREMNHTDEILFDTCALLSCCSYSLYDRSVPHIKSVQLRNSKVKFQGLKM